MIPQCVKDGPVYAAMREEMEDDQIMEHVPDMYQFWTSPMDGELSVDQLIALIAAHEYWGCMTMYGNILRQVSNDVMRKLIEQFGEQNIFVLRFNAVSNIDNPVIDMQRRRDILDTAIIKNQPDMMIAIYACGRITHSTMMSFARYGDTHMIGRAYALYNDPLKKANINSADNTLFMREAIKYGNVNFIKYYYSIGYDIHIQHIVKAIEFQQLGCVIYLRSRIHISDPGVVRHVGELYNTRMVRDSGIDDDRVKTTRLEMFKYAHRAECKVTDTMIRVIAASDDVDTFKFIVADYADDRIIPFIATIRDVSIMQYIVSRVGVPIVLERYVYPRTEYVSLHDVMMVDYLCTIGFVATQEDFEVAAEHSSADLLRVLLKHSAPTEPIIVVHAVECIKALHEAGALITHEMFQHVMDNMQIQCAKYIRELYPTWITIIDCTYDDEDVGPNISAEDAEYCLLIGCTLGPAMCEAAVYVENYDVFIMFHKNGAEFGNSLVRAILRDQMKIAIYMIKHGENYADALTDVDEGEEHIDEYDNATYQYISALIEVDADMAESSIASGDA